MGKTDLVIVGVSVGVAIGFCLAACAFFGVRWYRKQSLLLHSSSTRSTSTLPMRMNGVGTSTDPSVSIDSSPIPARIPHQSRRDNHKNDLLASSSGILRYSYKDVQKATQNFTTILGQGSFGPVYKATMPTGGVVAIKVLASDSRQGEKEFETEVVLLGRLHHRSLVNLVGYCVDKGQHMLIYEFMSNGSLEKNLYNEGQHVLSWEERVQIALDISHGIEYLHEGAIPPVIHRDLKSANILLDRSMRAKVADFGLSKEVVLDRRNSSLKGTYGYIDPEYISSNKFTKKSDIYSFGIIIFELITAIHPQQNLMEYVNLASMSEDGIDEILDKHLVGQCSLEEVGLLANIGHKCLHKTPRRRPSIGDVLHAISRIRNKRLRKDSTMSLSIISDAPLILERIEDQQVEMSSMTNMKERATMINNVSN